MALILTIRTGRIERARTEAFQVTFRTLMKTIIRRTRGDTSVQPFRYRDKGTMATVSRFQAIARDVLRGQVIVVAGCGCCEEDRTNRS